MIFLENLLPILSESINFTGKLKTAFKSILGRIGDPMEDSVLYGPLHSQQALDAFKV